MYYGFTFSIMMHAGLLAWALINITSTPPFEPRGPEPVEVALITDDDLVRLKKGNRQSKKLETQQAKTPDEGKVPTPAKPKAAPPPPPAEAAPPPEPPAKTDPIADKLAALTKPEEPAPSPKKDDQAEQLMLEKKKLEEAEKKAEAERQKAEAERQKAEAERKKAEAERKKADALKKKKAEEQKKKKEAERKRLADLKRRKEQERKMTFEERMDAAMNKALLDKDPRRRDTQGGSDTPPKTATAEKGPSAGAAEGTDDRLTASQRSMLGLMMKTATSKCWRINSGADGAQSIVIKVDIRLNPDGTLSSEPVLVTRGSGPMFQDAANAAVRAVIGCAPYDQLPANLYKGGWDYMRLTFDPRNMY